MDSLYFRQVKVGPMENFTYLIGDTETRECMVIDPAWSVEGILELIDADDMKLTGALITHYHPDHCGGSMFGFTVEGLPTLMEKRPVPVHVNSIEGDGLLQITGLSESDIIRHDSGDHIHIGTFPITCLHTPGHTPGSQCFRFCDALIAGDTLFTQGCGRVDLPGGDPDEMYRTLTQRLATLPDHVVLYPGHDYGASPSAPMGTLRQTNHYLKVPSLADWRRLMGR